MIGCIQTGTVHINFLFEMNVLGQLVFESASDFEITAKVYAKNKGFSPLFSKYPGMYFSQRFEILKLVKYNRFSVFFVTGGGNRNAWIHFNCNRCGRYRGGRSEVGVDKQRNSTSVKCGCKFKIIANQDNITGRWVINKSSKSEHTGAH